MTIYYNTCDGDRSARLAWFNSEKLSSWDARFGKKHMGTIVVNGSDINTSVDNEIQTPESYFIDEMLKWSPDLENPAEFYKEFFPQGISKFTLTSRGSNRPSFHRINIQFENGSVVSRYFELKETVDIVRARILNTIEQIGMILDVNLEDDID